MLEERTRTVDEQGEDKMKLYGNPMSGGTRLVLMALAEKKVAHELVVLDFMKGEHKQPAHLARQPFGKIPAIEHDGLTLFESRAIARYIGETFPGPSFLPSGAKERAQVDQWVNVELAEFYPTAHPLAFELVIKPALGMGPPDPATVERLRAGVAPVFVVLDKALEGKRYLVGEQLSLADMVFMPDLELLHAGGEGARIGKLANVARWWQELSALSSWRTAKATAA
jgi:glutathione S-transferase